MYCFCVLMLWLHCMPYRLKLKLICYILLLYRPLSLYYFMSLYWNITCKIMPLKTWNWIKIDRERPIERERECARVLVRARERESARECSLWSVGHVQMSPVSSSISWEDFCSADFLSKLTQVSVNIQTSRAPGGLSEAQPTGRGKAGNCFRRWIPNIAHSSSDFPNKVYCLPGFFQGILFFPPTSFSDLLGRRIM